MNDTWQSLIDATIVVHYGFLLYLLIGGFIAWRWPKTIGLHLLATIWAVLIVTTSVPCPLTAAQNFFRSEQGRAPLRDGFIELYVRGTLYPADGETVAQVLLALVVLLSWAGLARRAAQRRAVVR